MSKLTSVNVWTSALVACMALAACSSPDKTERMANSQEAQAVSEAGFVTVSGSVAYLQRIAMPPDAVLTVRVENVSRADGSAPVLAQMSEPFGRRQVPIRFSLKVAEAAVDPRLSYAVRATITVGGAPRFTTTRHQAVLTRGAPTDVALMLDAVEPAPALKTAPATAPVDNAVHFKLPATFSGVVPCADCAGIDQRLTLRADGVYRLRRIYLGRPDGAYSETGRWTADAGWHVLTLRSGAQTLMLAVKDDATLRLLDQRGQAIASTANLDLRLTAQVDPFSD